jgi:hypothetical protein
MIAGAVKAELIEDAHVQIGLPTVSMTPKGCALRIKGARGVAVSVTGHTGSSRVEIAVDDPSLLA